MVLGAVAKADVVGAGTDVPFADGSGGVAFGTHAVEDGGGIGREPVNGSGAGEVVDIVFVTNALLVGTGDDGGSGGRANRSSVCVGEKGAATAEGI